MSLLKLLLISFSFTLTFQPSLYAADPDLQKAISLAQKGQCQEALNIFQKINQKQATAKSEYQEGLCHQKLKNHPDAIKHFEKSLKIDPRYSACFLALADSYRRLNKPKAALSYFKKSVLVDPKPQTFVDMGIMYQQLKQNKAALASYKSALKQDKTNWKATYNAGQLLSEFKQYPQAIQFFTNTLAIKNDYWPAYLSLADTYLLAKQPDKALDTLIKLTQKNPALGIAYNKMALIQLQQGKEKEAIETYKKSVQNSKNPAEKYYAIYGMANIYYQQNDFKMAAKAYDLSFRYLNHAPKSLEGLGWSFIKLGFYKEAQAVFERYQKHHPKNSSALYGLGVTLAKQNKKDQAQKILESLTTKDNKLAEKLKKEMAN